MAKAREAPEARRIVPDTRSRGPVRGGLLEKAGFAMVREMDEAEEEGKVVRVKDWELAL